MRVPSALGLLALIVAVDAKAQPQNTSDTIYASEPDEFGNPVIIYKKPEGDSLLAQDLFLAADADGGCYWKKKGENSAGFKCDWDSVKTELTLKSDCHVNAPVPKDNYVGDKRINQNPVFLSGGEFMMRNPIKNNLCVDDGGGVASAQTKFHLWTCDPNNLNQVFRYDPATFTIRSSTKANLCVDDGGGFTAGGTKFHLYECNPSNNNQKFVYDWATQMFHNPTKPNMCMDDGGGWSSAETKFHLWDCDVTNGNQRFEITPRASFGIPDGPKITIEATKSGESNPFKSVHTTWFDYATNPTNLENSVKFSSFGTFDLKMAATDYRGTATCTGCVAIVDKFRPKSAKECKTTNAMPDLDYSVTNFKAAIENERDFMEFFDASVINNGDSDTTGANDIKTAKMTDFLKTEEEDLPLNGQCFNAALLSTLAEKIEDSATVQQKKLDKTLVCKRCCSKHRKMCEYYHLYDCDATTTPEKQLDCGDECRYSQCMTVKPEHILTASAVRSDAATTLTNKVVAGLQSPQNIGSNTIYQSITCENFNKGCTYQPKLSELFTRVTGWNTANGVSSSKTASDHVYWRYTVNTVDWKDWNDEEVLTFGIADSSVTVEAWSSCGRVFVDTFHVKLHPHTTRTTCRGWSWGLDQLTAEGGAKCAYSKSDFALLTFTYDSAKSQTQQADTVAGKYTTAKCYAKLAESTKITDATKADIPWTFTPDPTTGRIHLSKQLALELVHDPTTSEFTDVELTCDFTYQYFNSENTIIESCTESFSITDCDKPEIETKGEEAVCKAGECLDPKTSGPYEACNGNVITSVGSGNSWATQARTLSGACCAGCSKILTCNAVGTGDVRRCEPSPPLVMTMAMAMEHASEMKNAHTFTAVAGVSAMMALVALVVVKRRMAQTAKPAMDDAYVSLLD